MAARHPVDAGRSVIANAGPRRGDMGHGHLARVDHVDAHRRLPVLGGDQPALDGRGANAC